MADVASLSVMIRFYTVEFCKATLKYPRVQVLINLFSLCVCTICNSKLLGQ